MKNLSRILWGIVLVLVGLIWGLNRTGVTNIDIFFPGWWTLFIIVPSIISLFKPNTSGKIGSLLCLIIGVLLLLASLKVFDFELVFEIFWPAVVVIIGLSLILGNKNSEEVSSKIKDFDKNGVMQITATFGEQNVNASGEDFGGANINAIFGAVTLDLRDAKLSDEAVISCSAIFGGIDILVPSDCLVKVKATPIFGGVDNKKEKKDTKKIIYVDALALFGGIDIK